MILLTPEPSSSAQPISLKTEAITRFFGYGTKSVRLIAPSPHALLPFANILTLIFCVYDKISFFRRFLRACRTISTFLFRFLRFLYFLFYLLPKFFQSANFYVISQIYHHIRFYINFSTRGNFLYYYFPISRIDWSRK